MDQRVIGGAAVAVSFVVLFAAALIVGAVFDTVDTSRGFARWDQSVSQWGPDHATDGRRGRSSANSPISVPRAIC